MNIKDLYQNFHSKTGEILTESIKHEIALGNSVQFINDLETWKKILQARPESVLLEHSIQELNLSIYLGVIGLYRASYTSMRLALESLLSMSYFSVNRLELEEWKMGTRDRYWSELSCSESGVVSTRFAKAFFPEVIDTVLEYNKITTRFYRELSEFVHGNLQTQSVIGSTLEYKDELTQKMHLYTDTFATVAQYTLTLRYLNELSSDDRNSLKNIVLDKLSHLENIRNKFSET